MTAVWRSRIAALPIAAHLESITAGIASHPLTVLEAPPGTGKTTVLPLALLDQEWLRNNTILVLQPRRLASRSVASRMADILGEDVGGTIGYSVRLESKRSKRTRIEVITEGLLTRRLIADPELAGVGVVIFDEFHERSLHADVSLALTLETQGVLRPDLKVVVMSATLGESLPQRIIEQSWRYSFTGTTHPVTVVYAPGEPRLPLWDRAASTIRASFAQHGGDILAFLPGAYEITRTKELLERSKVEAVITPLFGDLSYADQSAAIKPDPQGRRKIVLATTIAETSLTIEGVRVVVDSGLHKVSRLSASGFESLVTEPITRDAADQRAGRAGRTAPGVCIRMWSELEHTSRRPYREPEVVRSDLTPSILDLAAWGVADTSEFNWVTPPPSVALQSATLALQGIGALAEDKSITTHGRLLAQLGAHPLLGSLAISARTLGLEEVGAGLIALLEERDILAGKTSTADLTTRLEAIAKPKGDNSAARRVAELRGRWLERIKSLPRQSQRSAQTLSESEAVSLLLALAFPGRIARRRDGSNSRYLLASGRGAAILEGDPLGRSEFLATCTLHDSGGDMAIRLAAPLSAALFQGPLAHLVVTSPSMEVDESSGALTCVVQSKIGAITLASRIEQRPSPEAITQAFTTWLSGDGFVRIPFNKKADLVRGRVAWARAQDPATSLPDLSTDTLQQTVEEWLLPHLPQPPSFRDLTEGMVYTALESLLSWQQRKELDDIAPPDIKLPCGRSRPLTYEPGRPPTFEARIQDLFGVPDTPRIGRFRIPATIHLLSPAQRPVQVTQDLASFWKNGYSQVRKELRGRYPKHKWPEDPLT